MTNPTPQISEKKLNTWLPLLLAMVAAVGIFIGFKLQDSVSSPGKVSVLPAIRGKQEVGKIEEILRFVEAKYVEDVDRDELVESAINGILQELDPHSNYISEKELESVNSSLEGSFDGIGVQFAIIDDTIQVISPIVGGPSEMLGIRAGDKIVEINDTSVAGIGITNSKIMERLRGKKGTDVNIGVMRGSNPEVIDFTITRDKIANNSLDVSYMVNDRVGFVKINRFSGTTYEEFMKAIEGLNEAGMKDLIIDVRQNPGGYLQAATKIVGQLFNDKRLLVYTEGRTQRRNEYNSTGRNFYDIDNVMVLIDEGSASASEILAGAVQDSDRGKIIGRRSFGKGLVQEQYDLRDGSALRLTVARYYTPSGRSIQKPYKGKGAAYNKDIAERFDNGEMENSDSISISDTTRYYTQDGRVVYAGGGITPDVFVALDPMLNNPYFIKVSQYIMEFSVSYLNKNRNNISQYNSADEFAKGYQVSEKVLEQFSNYALKKGVKKDRRAFKKAKSAIANRIKAHLARDLFKEEGFYRVWNQTDDVFAEAIKELK